MNETSFYYGFLVGEIIWEKHLRKYNEDDLLLTQVTQEEWREYDRLGHVIIKDRKEQFKEYRDYAHSLLNKYFPKEVVYNELFHFTIESQEDFRKGIENFLWDTDECCYIISSLTIEDLFRNSKGLTIKFKLEYA